MVSISSCSVDFYRDPSFGSSNTLLSNEYSNSGNTDDFIREVTERHNVSYGDVLCHVPSEEEIGNPFISRDSSRHSLLKLDSPYPEGSQSSDSLRNEDSSNESEESSKFNTRESRSSYSVSLCSISQCDNNLNDIHDLVVAPGDQVENVVHSDVLISISSEGTSSECVANSVDSTSSLGMRKHLLARQSTVFDEDQPDVARLTPTDTTHRHHLEKMNTLSVDQIDIDYSPSHTPTPHTPTPTTPTPTTHSLDVQPERTTEPNLSRTVEVEVTGPDELEMIFDDILAAGISEMEERNEKRSIPTRRHSNCELPSRGLSSLISLYQRRTSLSHAIPLTLVPPLDETRKLSDPAVCLRKELVKRTHDPKQKRCLSDSAAPSLSMEEDDCKSEECGSSALDSGYHDSRFQDSTSTYCASSRFSDDIIEPALISPTKVRRPTPYSFYTSKPDSHVTLEYHTHFEVAPPIIENAHQSKRFSQGSTVASTVSESVSMSSFWESQVSHVSVLDVLSSLGFDDFDDPQLVPDRFIPRDVEHVKPSMMKANSMDEDVAYCHPPPSISTVSDVSTPSSAPPRPPSSNPNPDLPLGATAENFLATDSTPPESPIPIASSYTPTLTTSNLHHYNTVLETVPEETASDLSPSPRWLSPRVSVDHSVIDLFEGKYGASLNVQKQRKRSFPQREGFKHSIGSQVESETGESIHVSVTSYDDDIAAEKEREKEEAGAFIPVEDCSVQRRPRRKGVYVPPASLLTWLTSQETISEERSNPEELPWPFSEQAKLRLSLTEIYLAQDESEALLVSDTNDELSDRNISSVDTPTCTKSTNQNRSTDACDKSTDLIDRLLTTHAGSSTNLTIDRSNACDPSPIHPSLIRRSRSLSPELLQRTESDDFSTEDVSDIRLNNTAVTGTMSPDPVPIVMYKERDYKSECQWLRTELSDLESNAHATEHALVSKVAGLENVLSNTEKRLTRQAAVNQDLQQDLAAVRKQLKETKNTHAAALVTLRTEAKEVRVSELQELRDKLRHEKASELIYTQEKHTKELNELKKSFQSKTVEVQQLSVRLSERNEACSALSAELRGVRKQAKGREGRLRGQLAEEKGKWEKVFHQEKVSALAKFQEQAATEKHKEITVLKDKLIEDKKTALSRLEQKSSEQISKLQNQLRKTREQNQKEVTSLKGEMEREIADEKQRVEQMKQGVASLKQELERVQRQTKTAERRHVFKGRESQRSADESILNGAMEEWTKSAQVVGQKRPRSLSMGNAPTISAMETALLGLKMTNELLRQQLTEVKEQLEKEKQVGIAAHRDKIVGLRRLKVLSQMDKQKALKSLAEKLNKEHALELAAKNEELKECPSNQEQLVHDEELGKKSPLSPSNINYKEKVSSLEKELKLQQRITHRARSLFKEKCQEVSALQAKFKQLVKEHLSLEKAVQDHFRIEP